MKISPHLSVICSLLALAACDKPKPEPQPEPAPVEQKAPSTPPPAPEPPKQAAAPATPEPNYLAPAGVYFLTAKTSLETNDGIVGYPPGSKVMQQADGRYQTADGQFLTLAPAQVTNDLRVARQVAGADAAAQAALSQLGRAQQSAAAAQSIPEPRTAQAPAPAAPTAPAPAPRTPSSSAFGDRPSGLGATHSAVKRTF